MLVWPTFQLSYVPSLNTAIFHSVVKVGFVNHTHLNQHLEDMNEGSVLWSDSSKSPLVYTRMLTSEQGREVEGMRTVEKDGFGEGAEP